MTLGSLSSDGWGCVPFLVVVCPENFQLWSLQVVGWCWVLVLKCGSLGALTLIDIPWYFHYQCRCPHSEQELTLASPGDPPRPLGMCNAGSYGGTALCWVPVSVRPCVRPPRVESLFSPTPWSSCTQLLLAFKAKCSGGSSAQCQMHRLSWSTILCGKSLCSQCGFNSFWCESCS